MKQVLFFTVAITLVSLSCTREITTSDTGTTQDNSEKILFTKSGASQTSLLVKFASVPEEQELEDLKNAGIIDISPLFVSVAGKKELERECGLDLWYQVTVPECSVEKYAGLLASDIHTSIIEYDIRMTRASDCIAYLFNPSTQPELSTKSSDLPFNDPQLSLQWNFKNNGNASIAKTAYKGGDINVYDVWRNATCGDPSIIVAVVDEGVKYTHPDLSSNMWKNEAEINGKDGVDDDGNGYIDDKYGYNFVANGAITWNKPKDSGHGTHCAGIISSVNNNGTGISSIAGGSGNGDGVKIMSCQIFDNDAGGYTSTISKAIKYAADNGASIISCSFGYTGGTFLSDGAYKKEKSAEATAIEYFEKSKNNPYVDGGIPIFASGNDGDPYATYPGACANIISVSAFGPDFLPTYYTNYGPGCNITAPGGEYGLVGASKSAMILSTVPSELYNNDYGYMQGTSMACPHVSGIAALGIARLMQLEKKMISTEFKEQLVTSANDFDSRIKGVKEYVDGSTLELYPFRKQMGTGSVDAWLFMMKLEGTPCLLAECGKKQWLDLSSYFGTSSVNLSYLSVEMEDAQKAALGLAEDPYVEYGRLFIHPTKLGSAKLTVKAVGGGTEIGGEERIGGMEISQKVSIIVRNFKSENGGWL